MAKYVSAGWPTPNPSPKKKVVGPRKAANRLTPAQKRAERKQKEEDLCGERVFKVGDLVSLRRGKFRGKVGPVIKVSMKYDQNGYNPVTYLWGAPYWAYDVEIEGKIRSYHAKSLETFKEISKEELLDTYESTIDLLRELEEWEAEVA